MATNDALTSASVIDPIVSVAALAAMLQSGDTDVVLIDCRHQLSDPEYGRREFERGHLPGARFAHLDDDLSGDIRPGITGRHPLPTPDEFAGLLRRFGVNPDSIIVCYDDKAGAIAARCWWMCRWIGHNQSFVLDGGIQAWVAAGYNLSASSAPAPTGTIKPTTSSYQTVDADAILPSMAGGGLALVDARGSERFRGEHEPIDPVAGHIPGAVNLPFADNLDETGLILDASSLCNRFADVLSDAKPVAVYCGSGVTAAHNLLAMERALLAMQPATEQRPLLYAGSWSDWITDPRRPVATDP